MNEANVFGYVHELHSLFPSISSLTGGNRDMCHSHRDIDASNRNQLPRISESNRNDRSSNHIESTAVCLRNRRIGLISNSSNFRTHYSFI